MKKLILMVTLSVMASTAANACPFKLANKVAKASVLEFASKSNSGVTSLAQSPSRDSDGIVTVLSSFIQASLVNPNVRTHGASVLRLNQACQIIGMTSIVGE